MALGGGEHFRVVVESDEQHEAAARLAEKHAWVQALEWAKAKGDKDGIAAATRQLKALGFTRESAHAQTTERATNSAPETR